MFPRVGQPTSLRCDAVCGGGVWEGTLLLAPLSAGFQALPRLPTTKLGPCGADSWVGGFVYILGPCGSLQQTLLWGWEFLPLLPQPPQVFSVRDFGILFLRTGLYSLSCSPIVPPSLPICKCGTARSASHCLAHPGPPAAALSRVLSILLPTSAPPTSLDECFFFNSWLLGFYTVRFFVSSGCFLFLNLVVFFFWLCEEAQCVYLCPHLGCKT